MGRRFVARELEGRGAANVADYREGRRTLLRASDSRRSRRVTIRVKTKTQGNWQARTADISLRGLDFWVFVDLDVAGTGSAKYFVMPDSWIRGYIKEHHQWWVAIHGGERPVTPGSDHVGIEPAAIEEWRGRWDVLGLF